MSYFALYVWNACHRELASLSEFERDGLSLAYRLGYPASEAFSFLGRFGTIEDIKNAQ